MTASALTAPPSTGDLARIYLIAKRAVIAAGYAGELHWQETRRPLDVTDVEFMRQSAWVILSAGMRESVVGAVFPYLGAALNDFVPRAITANPDGRDAALAVFAHERKIDAILAIATVADRLGTDGLRDELAIEPLVFLSRLPYMGPATSRHLAKNLGVAIAKPDRHLLRITESAGRDTPEAMCEEIASWIGEPVSVVDIVLWRWATIHGRQCTQRHCGGLPHD